MNPNVAAKGRSFKGAIAYIVHDPDQAKTDERVLFTETRNLRTSEPEKAAKVMAYTALHAAELKAAAGVKATGRKTDSPVYHMSLSWVPGESPSQADMMEAGEAALQILGYGEHEAVFAAHGDKAHLHLHIVVNRVHPVTGKTHNPNDDQKLLQRWGHEYDSSRGMAHHSPERAAKYEKDPEKRAAYEKLAQQQREKRGLANDNGTRPAWAAEHGATHPKSRSYQEIKAEYAARAKALVVKSRALALDHKAQWSALKEQQALQRASLGERLVAATPKSAAFNRAAVDPRRPLSWKEYQVERAALRTTQRGELSDRLSRLRTQQTLDAKAFKKTQLVERAQFKAAEKGNDVRASKNLRVVSQTGVREHGPEHQDHLVVAFQREAARPARLAAFDAAQKEKRGQLFTEQKAAKADLAQQLKATHNHQQKELRERVQTGKPTGRRPLSVDHRRQRAQLAISQREQRAELSLKCDLARRVIKEQWQALTDERTKAWEDYRSHRASQAKEADAGGPGARSETRSEFARVADAGRHDGRQADPGRESSRGSDSGTGRELKR